MEAYIPFYSDVYDIDSIGKFIRKEVENRCEENNTLQR